MIMLNFHHISCSVKVYITDTLLIYPNVYYVHAVSRRSVSILNVMIRRPNVVNQNRAYYFLKLLSLSKCFNKVQYLDI